jgi:hypothetical protein
MEGAQHHNRDASATPHTQRERERCNGLEFLVDGTRDELRFTVANPDAW